MTGLLDDLAEFAAVEVAAHDLEPWAEILHELVRAGVVDTEGGYWLVKAYNAYDDLGSAWAVATRWPGPAAWLAAPDRADAALFSCTQERRGLRGGRVLHHLASYAAALFGDSQAAWIAEALAGVSPEADFDRLIARLRTVWGAGRQTAFEWAEFLAKVLDVPVDAPHAMLWESEGPRRSIESMCAAGGQTATPALIEGWATGLRCELANRGVPLSWWDFETIVCDFHVMRAGRYYPGRHLAALRAEILDVPEADRAPLLAAWDVVVPEPWRSIEPGIDKALLPAYRDTGRIVTPL